MLSRFKEHIRKENLFPASSKILAAVSGGMDSVCLCHLLYEAEYDFAIAHCNFTLRGEESDRDEVFVRNLAEKLNVAAHVTSFDTAAYAAEKGISTQMAARELRYDWFRRIRIEGGYDFIATAHHSSDVAETVLINISKGTGIAGLHGIRIRNEDIVRPLLFAERDEIEAYMRQHGLVWREDSSNLSLKYQRNQIRLKVIPALKKINPAFEKTLQETVEKLGAVERIFRAEIDRFRQRTVRKEGEREVFNIPLLKQEEEVLIKLYELLREYGFNYDQVKDIVNSFEARPGKRFESSTHRLYKDRTELVLEQRSPEPELNLFIEGTTGEVETSHFTLKFEEKPAHDYRIIPSPDVAALDLSGLTFPLLIRSWKPGDKMIPLGMKQYKKVSDILTDAKVPLHEKAHIFVLVSGKDIVWIPGIRIDERYKLKPDSEKAWEARFRRRLKNA